MKKLIIFLFLTSIVFKKSFCQPPFYGEIQAFKYQDSINPPPQHAILFVGSSSFRKWTDVQNYFPYYPILNRGFGGSTLPDVIRYANDIIFPYNPKEIVIYCGENDFAADSTISAETVFNRFKTLFGMIRGKMSDVPVVFVSIKPSPSRRQFWNKMIRANELIKEYLSKQTFTSYVDVFHLMLNANKQPKPEIFEGDSLHINAQGYRIWQKAIEPYLVK